MKVYTDAKLRDKEGGILGHYSRLHGGDLWKLLYDGSAAVIGTDDRLGLLEPGTFTLGQQKK